MDVNLWQIARMAKDIIPIIRDNSDDTIQKRLIFHSSYLGRIVEPGNIPFAISKMALEGLFDAIRVENYHQDISGREFCKIIGKTPFFKDGRTFVPQI